MQLVIDRATATLTIDDSQRHHLTQQQLAVLATLASGKVVGRSELIRTAGLEELSARRCEGIILELRRIIGAETIVNLRKRGWRLLVDAHFSPIGR